MGGLARGWGGEERKTKRGGGDGGLMLERWYYGYDYRIVRERDSGGNTGSHYGKSKEEVVNWWDEQVMSVMVVMEWANAVSARRRGEVTGAKPF